MKFTVEKSGSIVSLAIEHEGKARRVYDIPVKGRVFVKGKAPEVSKLKQMMETYCTENVMNSSEFLDFYHKSRQDTIEYETKELLKCFMRIQNSIDCINVSDEIRFGDTEE
ncbi:hypothetical protein L1D31_13295 [Vibrio sp. Isolate23]|uniref:hypothetical protein n=1 Tax=Vibrio sp. Isolate23 TaxID=2908533 RepID=UPI001EFC816E|nr:hypothetical protein [Vibrio sp. Isolate23]MCG9683545.1 hypothetical protein [Vibrio sp. Isolate23]